MKEIFISTLVFLTTLPAFANQCTTWGCISKIETLYTNSSGAILVGTPLDETQANCTPASGAYFTLSPSEENADKVYSSLLAAYMSDMPIQIRIRENSGNCSISYVRLDTSY